MEYTVRLENGFEADSFEDAVAQMAAWVTDYGYVAGYRVFNDETEESVFIDAEDIDFNSLED